MADEDPQRDPRFGGATPERVRGEGTPLDLYFAPGKNHDPGQPVLVFQHIRKTAGTSFRRVLGNNLRDHRHLFLDVPKTDTPEARLGEWYRSYYHDRLRLKERRALVCVASHSANYLIPELDRPFRAITILRDPIDRVLSRYHFFNAPKSWTLAEYYRKEPEVTSNPEFFNGQARSLLEPHFDVTELAITMGPPPDADLWRERLFHVMGEHYAVGVQEHFEASVRMIGGELGWRHVEIPEVRVNTTRPGDEVIDRETHDLAAAANWLDVELHRHYEAVVGAASAQEGSARPGAPYVLAPDQTERSDLDRLTAEVEALRIENMALRQRTATLERRVRRLEYPEPIPARRKRPKAADETPLSGPQQRS